jgi:HK97 family phage major capsid protein
MTSAQQLLGLRAGRDKEWSDNVGIFSEAMIYRGFANQKRMDPAVYAERAGANSRVVEYLKSDTPAMVAGSTINASFIDYLRNVSAIDAMSRWTIPAALYGRIAIATQAWTADEIGEGVGKKIQTKSFSEATISPLKTVGIVAATKETLDQPVKNIRAYIGRAMRDAVSAKMNQTFFEDIEDQGASGVSGTVEDLTTTLADLRELLKMCAYGEGSKLFLCVNSDQAIWLTSLAASVGNGEMTVMGGRFFGLDVLVSDNLPSGKVFCIDATGIAFWDGGIEQAVSTEADLELEDGPAVASAPTVVGNVMSSLFQTGATAFKCERRFGFKVVRPDAVASLVEVAWAPANDSPAGS